MSLDIARGDTVALLGPTEPEKSTTVAMLAGLVSPAAGEVRACGPDPRTAVRRGRTAVMLQDAALTPGITVAELTGLRRRLYARPDWSCQEVSTVEQQGGGTAVHSVDADATAWAQAATGDLARLAASPPAPDDTFLASPRTLSWLARQTHSVRS